MITKIVVNLASLVLGLAIIGVAIYWQPTPMERSDKSGVSFGESIDRSYTLEQLAEHNGEDGTDCLVAVDGDV